MVVEDAGKVERKLASLQDVIESLIKIGNNVEGQCNWILLWSAETIFLLLEERDINQIFKFALWFQKARKISYRKKNDMKVIAAFK